MSDRPRDLPSIDSPATARCSATSRPASRSSPDDRAGPVGHGRRLVHLGVARPAAGAFCAAKTRRAGPKIEAAGPSASTSWPRTRRTCAGCSPARATTSSPASAGDRPGHGAPVLTRRARLDRLRDRRRPRGRRPRIVVGRVLDLEVGHEGGPLVFFRGGYGRYAPDVAVPIYALGDVEPTSTRRLRPPRRGDHRRRAPRARGVDLAGRRAAGRRRRRSRSAPARRSRTAPCCTSPRSTPRRSATTA